MFTHFLSPRVQYTSTLYTAHHLHRTFATVDLTDAAPSIQALRAAHTAILVTHRRVSMAWDAIDCAAPTVDRTGAETPAFRPAGADTRA